MDKGDVHRVLSDRVEDDLLLRQIQVAGSTEGLFVLNCYKRLVVIVWGWSSKAASG